MIHDFLIIKDGLPLLFKNFSIAKNIFSEADSLIMVSGFFSALNSFSDSFENLGTISELKLSNNDLKLSFLKDLSIPNLIYIATYDEKSKPVNILRILRKVARVFLQKFSIEDITARTMPPDFKRNSRIHQSWILRRNSDISPKGDVHPELDGHAPVGE